MMLFGEVAIELGFITVRQLKDALDLQARLAPGHRKIIGVILVERGYLTPEQVTEVLARAEQAKASADPEDDADTIGYEVG